MEISSPGVTTVAPPRPLPPNEENKSPNMSPKEPNEPSKPPAPNGEPPPKPPPNIFGSAEPYWS